MSSTAEAPLQRPWWGEFIVAGLSAVGAICFTNPIDVVKTRMTLQGQGTPGAKQPYPNVFGALITIGRNEGLAGLQRGLAASCLWQLSNVSVRFGVYSYAKGFMGVSSESPFRKWLASLGLAGISGGMAALASNPFFILKTRYQSFGCKAAVGDQHAVAGGIGQAAMDIYRTDGPVGFFRGLSAFAPRVIVASAVQLSTYDAIKEGLMRHAGLRDGQTFVSRLPLVVASSFVTGIAVVAAMQPFDFAATRLVNSRTAAEHAAIRSGGAPVAATPAFTGPLDVIRKTVQAEGIGGVYRGSVANYLRFGPYCVLVFVFVEQGRQLEAILLRRFPSRGDQGR